MLCLNGKDLKMDEVSKFVVKGFNSKLLLPKKIGIGLRQTKTLYV
jgi:hypothetical protein